MIRSFGDKHTRELFEQQRSARLPSEIIDRCLVKLEQIDSAETVEELQLPPGNRLHQLTGDRKDRWSVSVNNKWRVCFRFEKGDAHDVEIVDYH